MKKKLHCPYCGRGLTWKDGVLRCQVGGMELSEQLRKKLTECYVDQVRVPSHLPPVEALVSEEERWHCPQCARVLTGKPLLSCESCGKYLNEFLFELIELHPHVENS